MLSKGHLKVEEQICCFCSDFVGVVVFAGHHKLNALFSDLLEDAIVTPLQQRIGVTA